MRLHADALAETLECQNREFGALRDLQPRLRRGVEDAGCRDLRAAGPVAGDQDGRGHCAPLHHDRRAARRAVRSGERAAVVHCAGEGKPLGVLAEPGSAGEHRADLRRAGVDADGGPVLRPRHVLRGARTRKGEGSAPGGAEKIGTP